MADKIKVGVVGPGTIGHKVIWALQKQGDVEVVGAAKTSPDWVARWCIDAGLKMYASSKDGPAGLDASVKEFQDALGAQNVGGSIRDMLSHVDVVVDCSDGKIGAMLKEQYYAPYNKEAKKKVRVIFQGGEKANIGKSFNSRCNYDKVLSVGASDTPYLRTVSCNTTTLARFAGMLIEGGYPIEFLEIALMRRAVDPGQVGKAILDSMEVDLKIPSHQAPDLMEVLPIQASSRAYKITSSQMHLHDVRITFKSKAPSKEEFAAVFAKDNRVALLNRFSATGELKERSRRLNKLHPEVALGGDLFVVAAGLGTYQVVNEKRSWITLGCPQDSIVVVENVDAVKAITYDTNKLSRDAVMQSTDKALSLREIKKALEESYKAE
ncbi:Glyceraldehyde-3-phosphate dehydrogenase [uncultured archaeon]|nr:Glyceraldehyde-3-phosphate dehydrogenase [uncultured archaeon]